jgi:inner membrane protein
MTSNEPLPNPTPLPKRPYDWFKNSISAKILSIGLLILILLIPGSMVNSLINERQELRNSAIEEVAGKWGFPQIISGPVISVPYSKVKSEKTGNEYVNKEGYAHFLPAKLEIQGSLEPEKRYRGIYVVMLYKLKLKIKGHFDPLDISKLNVKPEELNFKKAFLSVGIADLKGVNNVVKVKFGDSLLEMEPGLPARSIINSGTFAPISIDSAFAQTQFEYELDVNGSQYVKFAPFGKETHVELTSTWGSPSFTGSFLPEKPRISREGFSAQWHVLHLNRNYPQQGLDGFIEPITENKFITNLNDQDEMGTFGVKLFLPVDDYQQTKRSAKYSSMFIFLTFLCFFFVEVLNKKQIHPIQYLMVGFAIILFYVLLLSISEHLNFTKAYWIACALILPLIVYYVWHLLHHKGLTVIVGGIFLILYGFFYSLLQLEDYALLTGSFGLLLILATVMYLTRNINWYNLSGSDQ